MPRAHGCLPPQTGTGTDGHPGMREQASAAHKDSFSRQPPVFRLEKISALTETHYLVLTHRSAKPEQNTPTVFKEGMPIRTGFKP